MQKITISEIIDAEKQMLLDAEQKYGNYYQNAFGFVLLLQDFIESAMPDAWVFIIFLAQVRKHSLLALFSTLRLHHVQAMLGLRQVLEAGASAAYAIGNPTEKGFTRTDKDGLVDAPQDLTKKRYEWLDKNYPEGSKVIKNFKTIINGSTAHSSMVYGFQNFKIDKESRGFHTPFFDFEDEYLVKTDLWQIGNILMGLMDLFYGINQNHPLLQFKSDFVKHLKELEAGNQALKNEMMKNPRYINAGKRASQTPPTNIP